jgi:hypothetical protein
MLGLFAEQMRMDLKKDLGQRIVEAARLAVMLHLQLLQDSSPIGGADPEGEAATDGVRSSSTFFSGFRPALESEGA